MQSCLNQLEQQLVQIPGPSTRGLASKPHTAESDNASVHRKIPLHMHLQQPGEALGQPNSHCVSVLTQVHRFVKSSDEHFNLSVDMLSAHTHSRFQTTTARCFYHR
ncbi:TPA: hypothetical protein ACH3X3_003861 [Trebouxia sp. C0006]